jgi:predicted metal-dependent RNase
VTAMGKRARKTHRLVLELAPNRLLNLCVRLEVNRSSRLIETDNSRVLDECTSERDETAFSDGHVRSLIVDLRVEGEAAGLT